MGFLDKLNYYASSNARPSQEEAPKKYPDILNSPLPDEYLKSCSGHNMSYDIYKVKATYRKTNRARTVQVYAHSEEDAVSQIGDEFLFPAKSVTKSDYEPPSKNQVAYAMSLGLKLPEKCCKEDASALISVKLKNFNAPSMPDELIKFALSKRLVFSMYLTKDRIYPDGKSGVNSVRNA